MNLLALLGLQNARRTPRPARRPSPGAASIDGFLDRALRGAAAPTESDAEADASWHDSSWALAGGLEVTELDADAWPLWAAGAVSAPAPTLRHC